MQDFPYKRLLRGIIMITTGAALTGCPETSSDIPEPPQEVAPLSVTSGFKVVHPGQSSYIDLEPYVEQGSQTTTKLDKVDVVTEGDKCSVDFAARDKGALGFSVIVDGDALCKYRYSIVGSDSTTQMKEGYEEAVMTVASTSAATPVLPSFYVHGALSESGEAEFTINLEEELVKVSDVVPGDHHLSEELTVLGDGTATKTGDYTFKFNSADAGVSQVYYALESDDDATTTFGSVYIVVSEYQALIFNEDSNITYKPEVVPNSPTDIDVASLVDLSDAPDDWQIIYINSMTATVQPKAPEDVSNKVFEFEATSSGTFDVMYVLYNHAGTYRPGIIRVTVTDTSPPPTWDDIVASGAVYSAPLQYSQAQAAKVETSGAFFDNSYTPAIPVATFTHDQAA
ncbi:hypothetical protein CGI23_24935, partial [Vibrio parahaemolyticus]